MVRSRLETEATIQEACVSWFRFEYGARVSKLLFHTPNGGFRNALEAKKFKRMGVVAGVADLILMIPNEKYHALCVEMKKGTGKQTENQKEWQKLVEERGYKYEICYSLENFIEIIRNYFGEN